MSTESIDPQVIERTRQQIRSLIGEIAQLARSGVSPGEFYGEFLPRVVSALAAIGGAVWTTNDEGRLALQYQINLAETKLGEKDREDDQIKHSRLLHKVLTSGEGALVLPHSGAGDDKQAGNPTDFLLVLGPLKTDVATEGVVEIFQRPEAAASTQKGYLRFLLEMCALAGDFLKGHQLRHFTDRQALWTQLEEFSRRVHNSLEPKLTAYTIANEGRRLIDCDRVTVAIRRGRKCVIEAISGQDMFEKRSNTVRFLARLATEVVAAGEPIWYTGDTASMAPQIEEAVQEYVDESHTKTLAILPLKREISTLDDSKEERKLDNKPPFAALIVENIENVQLPETMVHRVEVVARHSAEALGNALEYNNLFLMPLWRAIGTSRWLVNAKNLPITVSVSVAVVLAILFMIFWPADFQLICKGSLEPIERRDVFAGVDGTVEELYVKHGDMVAAGQMLVRLRNTELGMKLADVTGQLATATERTRSLERALLEENHKLTVEERNRLYGELSETKEKAKSARRQKELISEKLQELEIKSPLNGKVLTWDLYNHLRERPVTRGQILMRIADLSKDWQLELRMPEDRMGHVINAQHNLGYGDALPVSYILATRPGTAHKGTIKEVQRIAEVKGDEGSTVLIKVRIDKQDLPDGIIPGTQISAKVYCGRRSIGYVWFHDLVAFIQSRVLFRL